MSTEQSVRTGSRVLVRGADATVHRLVLRDGSAFEWDGDAFVLPPASALGAALMGHHPGDQVEVTTRSRTVRFTIEQIEG